MVELQNIGGLRQTKVNVVPVPQLLARLENQSALLPSRKGMISHRGTMSLRELLSATGEELSALLPSVLDRAFKGEL